MTVNNRKGSYLISPILGCFTAIGFLFPHYFFVSLISLVTFIRIEFIKSFPSSTNFFLFYLCFFIIGCHWLIHPLRDFAHIPSLLSNIIIMGLCAYFALIYTLVVSLYKKFFAHSYFSLLFFSILMTLAEFVRSQGLGGFPFLMHGYLLTDTPFSYFIPILGVYGMTMLLFYFCLSIVGKNSSLKKMGSFIIFISCLLMLLGQQNWTKPIHDVKIGIIQTNNKKDIFDNGKLKDGFSYINSRIKSIDKANLIIWPEGAFLLSQRVAFKMVNDELLIGGVFTISNQKNVYNSMVVFNAMGTLLFTHHKYYLAQFNETIPEGFIWLLKLLNLPHVGLKSGSGRDVIYNSEYGIIGSLICYELLFPQFVHQYANQVNYFIVVNDLSWFLGSSFDKQYTHIGRFIAKSTQKPLMIASNYGSSQWIDSKGNVVKELKPHTSSSFVQTIQIQSGKTPIAIYGDGAVALFLFIVLILLSSAEHLYLRRFVSHALK